MMTPKIDPETELPIGPFKPDPVNREIRDAELAPKTKAEIVRIATLSGEDVWDWGGDKEP